MLIKRQRIITVIETKTDPAPKVVVGSGVDGEGDDGIGLEVIDIGSRNL